MVARNKRKAAVLGVLLRDGSITTKPLVERWNLSYSGAQASLERYRRSSLISRLREPGPGPPVYRYQLTRTGRRKAAWFVQRSLVRTRKAQPVVAPVDQSPRTVVRPPIHRRRVIRPNVRGRRIIQPDIHGRRVVRPKIRRRRVIRPTKIRNRRVIRPNVYTEGEDNVKNHNG